VVVEEKLYMTGSTDDADYSYSVLEYEPGEDKWLKLNQYKCELFAMVALNNKLTLVGGREQYTGYMSNQIAVWEKKGESNEWTHPYPPMLTSRSSPAIATYNQWLVVAGGRYFGDGAKDLDAVELLNTDTRQWLSAAPLPVKCSLLTSAVVHNELFLIGGTLNEQALAVSLPDITQSDSNMTWRTLPALPLEASSAIALRGSLLAVGGRKSNVYSTAIHVYQPSTNDWNKVGDLPAERSSCSCALLPSGYLMVAGGVNSSGHRSSRVDMTLL